MPSEGNDARDWWWFRLIIPLQTKAATQHKVFRLLEWSIYFEFICFGSTSGYRHEGSTAWQNIALSKYLRFPRTQSNSRERKCFRRDTTLKLGCLSELLHKRMSYHSSPWKSSTSTCISVQYSNVFLGQVWSACCIGVTSAVVSWLYLCYYYYCNSY